MSLLNSICGKKMIGDYTEEKESKTSQDKGIYIHVLMTIIGYLKEKKLIFIQAFIIYMQFSANLQNRKDEEPKQKEPSSCIKESQKENIPK
jgi:hypothetical protein